MWPYKVEGKCVWITFEVKENYSNMIERKTLNTAIRIRLIKNA